MLVVGDLEDEAAEGPLGVGLAFELGPLLGVVADDGRPVERAGQVGGDGVEQALDADVLEAGPAEDGLGPAGEGGPAEGGDDVGLGELGSLRGGPCSASVNVSSKSARALSIRSRQSSASGRMSSGISASVIVEPRSSVL